MILYSAVIVLSCVFRHQLPAKADFIEQCIHRVTRTTNDGHDESVHDHSTQGIGDSSLLTAIDPVSSMLCFSSDALNKTIDIHNDLHVVKPAVETGTAISQCGCTDECASITLIAHCFAQYISILHVDHQKHVQSLLQSDTVSWISKLFR